MPDDSHPNLEDDDVLLAELKRAVAEGDPVPDAARALAHAAFDLGRVDEELAELVFDSLFDEPEVAMRHAGAALATRSVAFIAHGMRIDLDLVNEDGGLLIGQINPPTSAAVVLERPNDRLYAVADDLGRFRFSTAIGSARLRFTLANGDTIVTPWITW